MKKYIIIIAISLASLGTIAQNNLKISIDAGYGTYQFDELKQFQTDLIQNYPGLPFKAVEQYPGFLNYSAAVEYRVYNNLWAGLNGGYYTTGGRNHIADYSGEYKLDIPVSGIKTGAQLSYIFPTDKKIKPYIRLKGGTIFSTVKTEESFIIYDFDSSSTEYKFKATNIFGEPSAGLIFEPVKVISVYLNAGYQVDFKGELYKEGNNNEALLFQSGDKVRANWSGLRLSMGLSFRIF
ncbi:MAG: hypothetical protein PHH93_05100 [Prolixibacteraceae bacterium]|nr:hypothetical protein [Prolixibacteraceae bacterium]